MRSTRPSCVSAQEDVPMPYNERLEKAVLPSAEKIIAAVQKDLLRN